MNSRFPVTHLKLARIDLASSLAKSGLFSILRNLTPETEVFL